MGKYLVINGADFSANGVSVIAPETLELRKIKESLEALYTEHKRYTRANGMTSGGGDSYNSNRSRTGLVNAVSEGLSPFVVTPKSGYKITPIQSTGNGSGTGKFTFSWVSESVTFTDFAASPYVGLNLAYSDDAAIADGKSMWDFIDVALVSE